MKEKTRDIISSLALIALSLFGLYLTFDIPEAYSTDNTGPPAQWCCRPSKSDRRQTPLPQWSGAVFASPACLVWIFVGTLVGLIFGCIPGLSAPIAVLLFLPMTFGMDTITGISLLIALYVGSTSGKLPAAKGKPSYIGKCVHPDKREKESQQAANQGIDHRGVTDAGNYGQRPHRRRRITPPWAGR